MPVPRKEAKMKQLIINADDMGMSKGITYGCLDAFKKGIVSNISLMINMPYSDLAVEKVLENPEVKVGLHLCLTSQGGKKRVGKPVLSPKEVPSLIDEEGYFKGFKRVKRFFGLFPGQVFDYSLGEVEKELRAQVKKAMDSGLDLTHLDSNEGFHNLNQDYFNLVFKLCKEFNLPMRWPNPWSLGKLRRAGILTTDYLKYHYYEVRLEDKESYLFKKLSSLRDDITEFIVHPAYDDEELREISASGKNRNKELNILCGEKVKKLIHHLNIKLISFQDLRDKQRKLKVE